MNWFKRKKKPPKQGTFCYCPRCKNELIHSGSFVSDDELVTYKCSLCDMVTEWLFGDWIVKYGTFECAAFSDKEFKEKFEEEQ